ncbi:hypothetical protein ACFQZE_03320 [Paenibacillus sp. GCM10027627]|uniref:putative amidoligase domain-containing protein n=1 Tax=unclassified Paenibacillus TaxID=185978 RepID=UPI003631183F
MAFTWIWRGPGKSPILADKSASAAHKRPQAGDAIIAGVPQTDVVPHLGQGIWVLNEGAANAQRIGLSGRSELWRRGGLRTGVTEGVSGRTFRIMTAMLEPYRIGRIEEANASGKSWRASRYLIGQSALASGEAAVLGGGSISLAAAEQNASLRRAANMAVKALYILGLDIGEADIWVGDNGKVAVIDAWPLQPGTRQGAEALERFAGSYAAAIARTQDRRGILLGADPEFALLTLEGKLALASRFFGEGAGGAAGADAMLVGRRVLYPVAEIRPEPAATPAALAANVRRLLHAAAAQIGDPKLRWVAGAMPLPGLALGGHIHISGAPLTGRLLRMLDSCAAYPLALVEDPAGRGRRPRYGSLGDFRRQPYGGFEYRTLPSWLVSPAAAKAAFALALLCAREAHRIDRIPAREERFAAAYYAGDRTELAASLDPIAEALTSLEGYEEQARYIEPLFEAARQGKTWDERSDIRQKWRITMKN